MKENLFNQVKVDQEIPLHQEVINEEANFPLKNFFAHKQLDYAEYEGSRNQSGEFRMADTFQDNPEDLEGGNQTALGEHFSNVNLHETESGFDISKKRESDITTRMSLSIEPIYNSKNGYIPPNPSQGNFVFKVSPERQNDFYIKYIVSDKRNISDHFDNKFLQEEGHKIVAVDVFEKDGKFYNSLIIDKSGRSNESVARNWS